MKVYVVIWSIDYSCAAGVEGVFATGEAAELCAERAGIDQASGRYQYTNFEVEECEVQE